MREGGEGVPKTPEQEAIDYIGSVIQNCYMLGANDFELPTLRGLQDKVRTKEISPEEARKLASEIEDRKQSDH